LHYTKYFLKKYSGYLIATPCTCRLACNQHHKINLDISVSVIQPLSSSSTSSQKWCHALESLATEDKQAAESVIPGHLLTSMGCKITYCECESTYLCTV